MNLVFYLTFVASISKFTSLTPNFISYTSKIYASDNYTALCLLKLNTRIFFNCSLDIQCAKLGFTVVQRGHLKIYTTYNLDIFLALILFSLFNIK